MSDLLRALVVDDHPVMRNAVSEAIRQIRDEVEIVQAESVATATEAGKTGDWGLMVLDLGMPDGDGVSTIRALRKGNPATPILVFSMFDESQVALIVAEAGAQGFLNKASSAAELRTAIEVVLGGRLVFSQEIRRQLGKNSADGQGQRRTGLAALSKKERLVLEALGRGFSQKEVASKLAISVSSVGTYRQRILGKLELKNTSELLCFLAERRASGTNAVPW